MRELLFILTPTDGIPVTLTTSPDGWDESFIITERSRKYHGIFRSFTIPLKFVKQGATIIRDEFYRYGMAATCVIQVQKLNRQTLTYFTAYTGKIDFATFKDHDHDIEVMAVDGGLSQIIKSMEGEDVIFDSNDFNSTYPAVNANVPLITNPTAYHVYCMQVMQVFAAIVDKITGGKVTDSTFAVRSNFFTSSVIYNKFFLTTLGDLKYPVKPQGQSVYQSSLADFFQSMNACFCLGMGIETIAGVETLVIEQREYFYNQNIIKSVGDSKNLSIGLVNEFNFSKIKIGYPKVEYSDDAYVGNAPANMMEPNTETTFLISNTAAKSEYDLLSKYRADSVGFDLAWNSEAEDTQDTNLVILRLRYYTYQVSPGVYDSEWTHTLGALAKSTDPGTDVSTPWNIEISPKRNLLRHKRFINGCSHGLNGSEITLLNATNDQFYNETSLAEPLPSTQRDWYKEYEGFTIDSSDTWFRPLEINIEAAYPSDMVNLIAANPYGVIEFDYKKTTYTGYILKMETKLSGAGSVKYSLLCTDTNDLTKLIR